MNDFGIVENILQKTAFNVYVKHLSIMLSRLHHIFKWTLLISAALLFPCFRKFQYFSFSSLVIVSERQSARTLLDDQKAVVQYLFRRGMGASKSCWFLVHCLVPKDHIFQILRGCHRMVDGSIYISLNGAKGLGHDVFLLAFLIALFQCSFTTMTYGQTQVQTNLSLLSYIRLGDDESTTNDSHEYVGLLSNPGSKSQRCKWNGDLSFSTHFFVFCFPETMNLLFRSPVW